MLEAGAEAYAQARARMAPAAADHMTVPDVGADWGEEMPNKTCF